MSTQRRRRHRARRDDPARRGRRVHLGRHARRPLRGRVALTQEWAAQLPVRIAAQLAVDPSEVLDRVRLRRLDRSEAIALIAAQRGLGRRRPGRLRARPGAARRQRRLRHRRRHHPARPGRHPGGSPARAGSRPHTIPMLMPNGPAACVGLELGAQAGVHAPASACATGAEAIALGPGHDPLRPGRRGRGRRHRGGHPPAADRRLRLDAGHVDPQRRARARLPAVGQGPRRLRPRRGRRRRSCSSGPTTPPPAAPRIYARLAGAGITSDGYDIVQPHPEGAGAVRAIAPALARRRPGRRPTSRTSTRTPPRTPVGDMAEIVGAARARSATTRCSPRPSR